MSAPPLRTTPRKAPWPRSRTARRLLRSPRVIAGCIGLLLVMTMAVAPTLFSGTDPRAQNLRTRFVPPVWAESGQAAYPLGSDRLGRDIWSRTVHAARISVTVGLSAMLTAGLLGTAAGVIAGYFRGWVDNVIMRLADVQLGIPPLLLVIAVAGVVGPSLTNVILILAISGWVIYARTARGMVLSLREQEFVQSARALGAGDARIIVRHLVPNIVLPLIVIGSQQMALMILRESTLSFLGIGVPPNIPTWGSIIADGRVVIGYAPWISLVPGMVLLITVLSVNFLGDGLRDALDTHRTA